MEDEENDVYIGSHKDLYATSFVDEEFLSTGLTKENALEYFRRSPFYSEGDLVELEGSDSSEELRVLQNREVQEGRARRRTGSRCWPCTMCCGERSTSALICTAC